MADQGFGVTVSFDTGFLAEILNVNGPQIAREGIDTTHSTTTNGWETSIPSDIKRMGELSVEIAFDPDESPPVTSQPETVTITFPIPAGGNSAATWACSGYLTAYEPSIPIDDRMTANVTIRFTGEPTFTPGS